MASWIKEILPRENGEKVSMLTPYIISASRSTDIPAFYTDWFFHRMQVGYSVWRNPFNGSREYISYKNTRFIVFWSKNPRPLLNYTPLLKEKNIGCYIQYTLNDYEKENLETGVPSLSERIGTFKKLVDTLGYGSVIWRFDPMILTDCISIDDLLEKVRVIGSQLRGYTEKMVFSFADISTFRKVCRNLNDNGINYIEWTEDLMDVFGKELSNLNKSCGWNFQLATCGEKIDVSRYGILHNRCIDGDLITRLAWRDKVLMDFMKVDIKRIPEKTLFGDVILPENAILLPENQYFISSHRKDSGQRQLCGCMVSKDIGEYNTCAHLCEYCYANTNKAVAKNNYLLHQTNSLAETIIP